MWKHFPKMFSLATVARQPFFKSNQPHIMLIWGKIVASYTEIQGTVQYHNISMIFVVIQYFNFHIGC
jgi:hypothetical protein